MKTTSKQATMKAFVARMQGQQQATSATDPDRFFNSLNLLPNPDPILRSMGRAEWVYQSIMADSHVIGDIRSIRGQFRSMDYRVVAGDDKDPASVKAKLLCEDWLSTTAPNAIVPDWMEVMWQMTAAILTGYAVHEVVWQMTNGKYLPSLVIDRPARRIKFNQDAEPLLISKGKNNGEPFEPYQFLISKHMATAVNPYGIALLSSCFWPWTFKTGGWRFFVKYCERHGLPWPFGRYPQGTSEPDQEAFAQALANMLESGYVIAPEGTSLELLTPTSSGSQLPQENLIDRCNREMSKALTGQAMTAELQNVGARAASETALKRQESINDADRDIAAASMSKLFEWITKFNFGDGIAAPKLEFYEESKLGKDRAETYQLAANMLARPSKSAMLEELGIPAAENDDDALLPQASKQAEASDETGAPAKGKTAIKEDPETDTAAFRAAVEQLPGYLFAKQVGITLDQAVDIAANATDAVIEQSIIEPIANMLATFEADGRTLAEFETELTNIIGTIDDTSLRQVVELSLQHSALKGLVTNSQE